MAKIKKSLNRPGGGGRGAGGAGVNYFKKTVKKSVNRKALKAANKPSKFSKEGQIERAKFMNDVMGIYSVQKTKNLKQAYRVNQINRRNPILSGNKADLPKKATGPKNIKDLTKMKKALSTSKSPKRITSTIKKFPNKFKP